LIKKTLTLPLSTHVKGQDIYLPLGGLRTHREGIIALWDWLKANWEEIEKRLPPGLSMLGSVVSICTSGFTDKEKADEVAKWFGERKTKGFDQSLAQSLEGVRSKGQWIGRDRSDVEEWLKKGKYL
jgi:aminopeptidase 2